MQNKIKALENILSIRDDITEIDFSGGDPLCDDSARELILIAINKLGSDKIYVTTTGEGIKELPQIYKHSLLRNCEITLETASINDYVEHRRSEKYNLLNYYEVINNSEYINNLIINIPLINKKQLDKPIELITLINAIPIKNKTVSLIRFMPVGKAAILMEEDEFDITHFINCFNEYLDKSIKLKLMCAFRGEYGLDGDYYCNMFLTKLGIDCSGNVFTCPWCAYIETNIQDNQFFLGNIVNDSLAHILQNDRSQYLKKHLSRESRCHIFKT